MPPTTCLCACVGWTSYGGEHEAAIGTIGTTTMRIYDWVGDTDSHAGVRAASVFDIPAGTHASADPETPADAFKGWELVRRVCVSLCSLCVAVSVCVAEPSRRRGAPARHVLSRSRA